MQLNMKTVKYKNEEMTEAELYKKLGQLTNTPITWMFLQNFFTTRMIKYG